MSRRSAAGLKIERPRPRRGTPNQTRERIMKAAAEQFNRLGYHGTDSNSIAKEAGYATGTFYKHFRDKKQVFLAVYQHWVATEWKAIDYELSRKVRTRQTARRIVEISIDFHSEWRGLRASLMELIFSDPDARMLFRNQRRWQLDYMAELRSRLHLPFRTREQDAMHLFMTERIYDAIGQGEVQTLGLDEAVVVAAMVDQVHALLK